MGLFDKLKNIANQVTGGGAKVTLIVEGSSVKGPVKLHITAVVKDTPLPIEKVYVYVKSIEKIDVPRHNLPGGSDKNPSSLNLDTDVFQKLEFTVSPAQTLEGGKTYNWTHELTLPNGAHPSYVGKYSHHQWQFYAGLDAKGNDPDSGWITANLN